VLILSSLLIVGCWLLVVSQVDTRVPLYKPNHVELIMMDAFACDLFKRTYMIAI
jgi:hypothetical protein